MADCLLEWLLFYTNGGESIQAGERGDGVMSGESEEAWLDRRRKWV